MAGVTQASTVKTYQQFWMEYLGCLALAGVHSNAIFVSKLAEFFIHLFWAGLVWHAVGISCSAIATFLNISVITRLLIVLLPPNVSISFIYSGPLHLKILICGMSVICYPYERFLIQPLLLLI